MSTAALETLRAEANGSPSRFSNAQRKWVPPTQLFGTVGTWTVTNSSSVWTYNHSNADDTSVIYVPCTIDFSDLAVSSGSGVVDRGVRVIGLEVLYTNGTADLDAVIGIALFKDTVPDTGGTAMATTSVTVTQTVPVVTQSAVQRRGSAFIAASDRFFLTNAVQMHGEVTINAAATSVVKVQGCIWHYEKILD